MVASQAFISLPRHGLHCSLSSSSSSYTRSATPRFSSVKFQRQPSMRARIGQEGDCSLAAAQNANSVRTPTGARHRRVPPVYNALSDQDSSLKTVFVEDEDVSLEGVAKVDKEESARPSWSRAGLLAGGDVLVLLAFAAIGRMSHGMPAFGWDTFRTADPFIAGWLMGSYFLGGYGPEGQGVNGLPSAVFAAAKSWAVGIPLGLAIRGATIGHAPAEGFIFVSLASTFVLIIGWRSAFTAAFPNDEQSKKKRAADRQGGVFELFELLASLIRRW